MQPERVDLCARSQRVKVTAEDDQICCRVSLWLARCWLRGEHPRRGAATYFLMQVLLESPFLTEAFRMFSKGNVVKLTPHKRRRSSTAPVGGHAVALQ